MIRRLIVDVKANRHTIPIVDHLNIDHEKARTCRALRVSIVGMRQNILSISFSNNVGLG